MSGLIVPTWLMENILLIYTTTIHHRYSKRKSVNGRLVSRGLFHDLDRPDALGPFTIDNGLVWKRFPP
jgi:hypothetical protein